MSKKQDHAANAALAALGVGVQEQERRMPKAAAKPAAKAASAPQRCQVSVQFTVEGLALLRSVQARLLERGEARAHAKGVAIEVVLREWLAKN